MRSNIFLLALATLLTGSLHAEVKPNTLFSDGAVLQRGQTIPVWGTARDGEKVTVEFQGQKATTTAAGGKWSVHLDPLTAGAPFTMTVSGLTAEEHWTLGAESGISADAVTLLAGKPE